jgi:SEC-C motif-containing protein
MRSRYSAFAIGDADYLLATWHPSSRPPSLQLDTDERWLGLEVLATTGGGLLEREGTVLIRARAGGGEIEERSRFTRVDGRWVYLGPA